MSKNPILKRKLFDFKAAGKMMCRAAIIVGSTLGLWVGFIPQTEPFTVATFTATTALLAAAPSLIWGFTKANIHNEDIPKAGGKIVNHPKPWFASKRRYSRTNESKLKLSKNGL